MTTNESAARWEYGRRAVFEATGEEYHSESLDIDPETLEGLELALEEVAANNAYESGNPAEDRLQHSLWKRLVVTGPLIPVYGSEREDRTASEEQRAKSQAILASQAIHDDLEAQADRIVENSTRFLDELVRQRRRSGLTRGDVAERMGVSNETVAEFEHYDSNPTMALIRRYVLAIGAGVSYKVEPTSGVSSES